MIKCKNHLVVTVFGVMPYKCVPYYVLIWYEHMYNVRGNFGLPAHVHVYLNNVM